MSKQTRYNQILFLMTFSVCVGLVLAGGAANVSAQTQDSAEITTNKRPLLEFRDRLVVWCETEKNDLYQPFEYSLEGTVDKEGKLSVKKPPVFNGEPKMLEVVKNGVAAFSDSGYLKFLGDTSEGVKILITQDGKQFNFKLEISRDSENRAASLASGLNTVIAMGKLKDQYRISKETSELLELTKINRIDKAVVIDMSVPNEFVENAYQKHKQNLVKKHLLPEQFIK